MAHDLCPVWPRALGTPGDEFGYTFDLGDNWRHHCVVDEHEIDPEKVLGVVPHRPLPY
jgi:hypothetical protein